MNYWLNLEGTLKLVRPTSWQGLQTSDPPRTQDEVKLLCDNQE